MTQVHYRTVDVDGYGVFYREAGDRSKPTLLLLHGFPTSSHMFRDLIPLLADSFHLVAPDLPGFGLSALPARQDFTYSFDTLATVIGRFTEVIGLDRFAIYIFDYGAPTGLRIAMAHPERVTAIVSQNGNAYEEGLSQGWDPIQRYWRDPSDANRQVLRQFLTPEAIRWQYEHGVSDATLVSPDGSALDAWYTGRPGVGRDPARPLPRLREQRRALPRLPGLLPPAPAEAPGDLGPQRPLLPAAGCGSVSARSAARRGAPPRHRPLRAGDARGRDRGRDPPVSGTLRRGEAGRGFGPRPIRPGHGCGLERAHVCDQQGHGRP